MGFSFLMEQPIIILGSVKSLSNMFSKIKPSTAYLWCSGHSISIIACGVWGVRVRVQVSRRDRHTHIHLDYARVEFLSCIKKIK